jgi:hypothetical protein
MTDVEFLERVSFKMMGLRIFGGKYQFLRVLLQTRKMAKRDLSMVHQRMN